jgi:hypothetical protein
MTLPKLAIGQTWLRKDGETVTVISQDKEGYFRVGGLYYFGNKNTDTNTNEHNGPSLSSMYNLVRLLSDTLSIELPLEKQEELLAMDQPAEALKLAARWGADKELEACELIITGRKWFADPKYRLTQLRNARRPITKSLKEQALERLELAKEYVDVEPILRALEALPE